MDAWIALIGVGADSTFGHPAPSVLALLDGLDVAVLRTDQHGTLLVGVDEHGFLTVGPDPG